MLQRLISILLLGAGLYGFFNGAVLWLSILLIIIGASVFSGANHGVWFYFGFNDDSDSWGDSD